MSRDFKIGKIDARFTANARRELEAFLAATDEPSGYLGLTKSCPEGGAEFQWSYGLYTRYQVERAAPEIEAQGICLLYHLDGLVVVCPSFHLLDELEGKLIDTDRGSLVLVDQP